MPRTRLLPVVAMTGLLLGSAGTAAARAVDRTIEVDGRSRSYRIHVPARIDAAAALPVLLVFHGAGSDVESMVTATGFDQMADRERFLVVYPRALVPARRFDVEGTPARPSGDVRFVQALLERLRSRFRVDERRIFATGFSNGAAFCYRLAAEMPTTFTAIAPVAGYLPGSLSRGPRSAVRLLHVHGTQDPRVPLTRSILDGVAGWASGFGCAGAPQESVDPSLAPLRARRVAYACPAGAEVALLLLEGVGHSWPGGADGTLSRAVWRFLRGPVPEVTSRGPASR